MAKPEKNTRGPTLEARGAWMSSCSWRTPGTSLKSQKRPLGSLAAPGAQAAPSDRAESC